MQQHLTIPDELGSLQRIILLTLANTDEDWRGRTALDELRAVKRQAGLDEDNPVVFDTIDSAGTQSLIFGKTNHRLGGVSLKESGLWWKLVDSIRESAKPKPLWVYQQLDHDARLLGFGAMLAANLLMTSVHVQRALNEQMRTIAMVTLPALAEAMAWNLLPGGHVRDKLRNCPVGLAQGICLPVNQGQVQNFHLLMNRQTRKQLRRSARMQTAAA